MPSSRRTCSTPDAGRLEKICASRSGKPRPIQDAHLPNFAELGATHQSSARGAPSPGVVPSAQARTLPRTAASTSARLAAALRAVTSAVPSPVRYLRLLGGLAGPRDLHRNGGRRPHAGPRRSLRTTATTAVWPQLRPGEMRHPSCGPDATGSPRPTGMLARSSAGGPDEVGEDVG